MFTITSFTRRVIKNVGGKQQSLSKLMFINMDKIDKLKAMTKFITYFRLYKIKKKTTKQNRI